MESRNTIGFALPEAIAAELEAEPEPEAEPVVTGPTITPPDQLDGRFIPYESADRTPAGPLQMLEEFTARHLGIDRRQLVSREGDILERGSVCLFQTLPYLGAIEPDGWAIAVFRADGPADFASFLIAASAPGARFRATTRAAEHAARIAYLDAKLGLA